MGSAQSITSGTVEVLEGIVTAVEGTPPEDAFDYRVSAIGDNILNTRLLFDPSYQNAILDDVLAGFGWMKRWLGRRQLLGEHWTLRDDVERMVRDYFGTHKRLDDALLGTVYGPDHATRYAVSLEHVSHHHVTDRANVGSWYEGPIEPYWPFLTDHPMQGTVKGTRWKGKVHLARVDAVPKIRSA